MEQNEEEYILVFEAPKIVAPEFRLYYDEAGKVVCYTCEKLEGRYIIVDALTYAQARPDVRVIDGKISTVSPNAVVSKLMPSSDEGQVCSYDDISIVVAENFKGNTKKWKLVTYEL